MFQFAALVVFTDLDPGLLSLLNHDCINIACYLVWNDRRMDTAHNYRQPPSLGRPGYLVSTWRLIRDGADGDDIDVVELGTELAVIIDGHLKRFIYQIPLPM